MRPFDCSYLVSYLTRGSTLLTSEPPRPSFFYYFQSGSFKLFPNVTCSFATPLAGCHGCEGWRLSLLCVRDCIAHAPRFDMVDPPEHPRPRFKISPSLFFFFFISPNHLRRRNCVFRSSPDTPARQTNIMRTACLPPSRRHPLVPTRTLPGRAAHAVPSRPQLRIIRRTVWPQYHQDAEDQPAKKKKEKKKTSLCKLSAARANLSNHGSRADHCTFVHFDSRTHSRTETQKML
ncbi:hypothetical protein MAPG_00088 [Magnaporthiopsis poae ATCC 64411]|uniref:Uncharacterized protein n=1 Tax=Magnaporthiopsis poae (strain ATCC 64411 / 73-15) TaxID=644358 RepID=A0A0C4DK25_MAGP6|nr:hypothetical protein MAPG_00088 [Magnaporthiopsis poae ATCC 64411]